MPAWGGSVWQSGRSDLAQLQAVAAVGQSRLVETYERALRTHGRHAGQVLLTAEDVNDRQRYLNVRNTILALLEYGAVPIVNENDTVSVAELQTTFGDNDQLAAIVTNLWERQLLVVLSDVEGLFDGHPMAGVEIDSHRDADRRADHRAGSGHDAADLEGGHGEQAAGG